ncbi:MAG TPA: peptidoglycan-binding protein [Candidatus Absconditabacterales bacterium]|nr:peptidoglycan-binding protein [Candidatus Absconditabacterales bacterium]
MNYSKILLFSTLLLGLFSSTYGFDFTTDCQKQTFVVTAYYSPEDNQTFYYKPSVEEEKILNGNGTHGANGKAVFNGMLAAPSTYDFGGKIYFPSLGVGEIADRGGAIVHAGERGDAHDRIDIWMGKGEEGLVRALTFGKRTVTGYYCTKQDLKDLGANPKVGLDFDTIPILKYFFDSALFIQEIWPERTDVWVYKLQEYLMKFGYMDKKTGYFGPQTKRALCNYQIKRGITTKKYCGVFGKRTRYYMKLEAKARGLLPDFSQTTTFEDLISYAANYNGNRQNLEIINSSLSTTNYFNIAYKKGTTYSKISDLQDMLRHYGFYHGDLNSTYDGSTINAVYDFQIAAGILSANDYSNPARGWMGPSTRKALNEKRTEFQSWKNQEK